MKASKTFLKTVKKKFLFYLFIFLAMPHGLWDF